MTHVMLFTQFGKGEIWRFFSTESRLSRAYLMTRRIHRSTHLPWCMAVQFTIRGHMTNTACIHNACDTQRVHSTTEADRGFASKMRLLVGNRACIETTFLFFSVTQHAHRTVTHGKSLTRKLSARIRTELNAMYKIRKEQPVTIGTSQLPA